MKALELDLPGVLHLQGAVHADRRGYLMEVFQVERAHALGLPTAFAQDNHAHSVRGVIRGLHWQLDAPQGKLVTVLQGSIFDVVADVRPTSATGGRWVGITLEAGTGDQLWIPPGYAHGFCVLSDAADVLYKNTEPWRPGRGRGVRYDDPTLAVRWPMDRPILSDADAALPWLEALGPEDLP